MSEFETLPIQWVKVMVRFSLTVLTNSHGGMKMKILTDETAL